MYLVHLPLMGNMCIGVTSTLRKFQIHEPATLRNCYLQITNGDTGSGS